MDTHIRHRVIPGHGRRGFTMMELVVVVTIIAVIFAVAMPTMRNMNQNNRLRTTVRELTSLAKYARSEAVFNGRTAQLFLDVDNHAFWLDLRTPDPKTGRYDPKAPKSRMERRRDNQQQVVFEQVTASEANILDNGTLIAVDFFPDGTASPLVATLRSKPQKGKDDESGARYTLEVSPSTGLVKIHKGGHDETVEALSTTNYPLPESYYAENDPSGTGRY